MRPRATLPTQVVQQMTPGRIAVVGGLREITGILQHLESRGYSIQRATGLGGAATHLRRSDFDAALLLVGRGEEEPSLTLCRKWGAQNATSVVIIYGGVCGKFAVEALEAGADDCIASPANPREVLARLRSAARRRRAAARPAASEDFHDFRLDHVRLTVCAPGHPAVSLSQSQMRLLSALARRRGAVLSREALLTHTFGEWSESLDRAIDTQICRLRRRLEMAGLAHLIRAVPGVGYRLEDLTVRAATKSIPGVRLWDF